MTEKGQELVESIINLIELDDKVVLIIANTN